MTPRGANGASLVVRVTPRGGRDAIDGWTDDGVLKIRLAAAPADGKANAALIRLLARALAVPASAVTIVRGASSRTKHVHIDSVEDHDVRARLGAPVGG